MEKEELLAVLRLTATKNVGAITAKKLILATKNPVAIFKESKTTIENIHGIGTHITNELFNEKHLKLAEKELAYIEENNIAYSYFLDDNYPNHLQQCADAPILFFKNGNINLEDKKIVSVVGTRNCTNYGKGFIKEFIQDLKKYNPIIVSGFAYGCDIEAHKAAMANNLQTIGVLAHGLNEIYPKAHKKYINDMCKNGGFITEFWHDEQPLRENFLKRNRIVAGLSKATIVIESATKGGSLVTADIANSYNRDVFALSGRASDLYSKGCHQLIKNHQAHLLTCADDIVKHLNWDISNTQKPVQQTLFVELNETEQKIYDYLKENGKQLLDVIAIDCAIPVYQLSSMLVTMELKGIIKPLPGKLFEV